MKLNSSDDKIIESFDQEIAQLIDPEKNLYGIKIVKPNSIKELERNNLRNVFFILNQINGTACVNI